MLLAPFYMIFFSYTERPKSRFFGIQDEAHHYDSKLIPFLKIGQRIKNKKRNCADSRNGGKSNSWNTKLKPYRARRLRNEVRPRAKVAIVPDPEATEEAAHSSGDRSVKKPQHRSAHKP